MIKLFGKIRILFEMHDFHGWEITGIWEDMPFDLKHFRTSTGWLSSVSKASGAWDGSVLPAVHNSQDSVFRLQRSRIGLKLDP